MKLSAKKSEGNSAMQSYKRRTKFWHRIASAVLCFALLGTNVAGVLAADVSATETEVSPIETEISPIENIFSDEDISEKATEPPGETKTEESSTPSDTDTTENTTEDVPPAKKSVPSADEGDDQSRNAETSGVHITAWTWVDEEEILTEYDGKWYLSLPGANADDLTKDLLEEMLPQEVHATLSNDEKIDLPLKWDLSSLSDMTDAEKTYHFNATVGGDYSLANDISSPSVCFTFGGAEVYAANYPGNRRTLSSEELQKELQKHQVQGITPAGTTINLFDYVASKDGAIGIDLTEKVSQSDVRVAKSAQWNLGINQNRLLLFGDSIIGAGYWNNGAGAGRQWAKDNTNTKGIVESNLTDGYPKINIANANKPIARVEEYTEAQLPFCLKWAADENQSGRLDTAPALSEMVLNNNREHHSGNTSLDYLFDPNKSEGDNKRSYKNVTGLFQMDEKGYYYYDGRQNFAEFHNEKTTLKDGTSSDGSFTLYDGPAIWRTDGGWNGSNFSGAMSLGNFYPFNTGRQVFDSIDTDKKCLSSSVSTSDTDRGLDGSKWGNGKLQNRATGEDVLINHHMGMTMQVDFRQPQNGKLNMGTDGSQDMVFQFSGDDDVWIFVDNVLVLDLGGIHSELYGTINFATGEVVTGQGWRYGGLPPNPGANNPGETKTTIYDMFVQAKGQDAADKLSWVTDDSGKKIFPTGSNHTLKLFYLERGNYDSSLQMRYNLQPPLYHSIKKVDQDGNSLAGVEFELYKATPKSGEGDSVDVADYEVKDSTPIAKLTTGENSKTSFTRKDGSPFSFGDQFRSDGTLYYILKETKTAGGYRLLPKNIVLKFNSQTSMLVVQNRYQTGAYASFFSNIKEVGNLTYGQFNEDSGNIASSKINLGLDSKQRGLIVAVPMLLEGNMSHDDVAQNGKWMALYGSNTEGYGAVDPGQRTAQAWRKAVLKAALYQASDERWPEWRLRYNDDTGKLEGLLEDLPGRADRYLLNNKDGDMKMVYGIIEPSALQKLGITGSTSEKLYDALEAYVSKKVEEGAQDGKSAEEVISGIVGELVIDRDDFKNRDFSFLNTDQFQREFRSTIYIPNERRELRVQKVDEDGKGINGVEFTLTDPNNTSITGTTAKVGGMDGVLIFRPDAPENAPGYAKVEWAEVDSKYTLKETKAPESYEQNTTEIPVVVGIYSIYADAGGEDDGVTVMAGVGKLMQTMTKYAADDMVNITLRDITAIAQVQDSSEFQMNGWRDDKLKGTELPRSMNLHYGINAVVDYGLHDEDGGQNIYPFFTTDVGYLRTRVEQNTNALQKKNQLYQADSHNTANWDNLRGRDLTSLFSLLNTVVVTNKKTTPDNTGKLRISKTISGEGLSNEDYTKNFNFTVKLEGDDGTPLNGEYYYYGEQRAGYIKNGDTISLRHDEALTILGLPTGTHWTVSEQKATGWSVIPESGTISGTIAKGEIVNASFTNYKGDIPLGGLTVSKTVSGNAGKKDKDFNFTVALSDKTITGQFGEMTFTNGVASFTLKHGESKTASKLPVGITYEVTEKEANQDGYITDTNGDSGTIAENVTNQAKFTNTKNMTDFSFTKVKSEDHSAGLNGAEFQLYQLVCTDETHDHSALVDVENPGACWELTDTQTSNPKVTFTGLLSGEYRLVETKAPNGRVLPTGQWEIQITADQTITIKGLGNTSPPAFAVGKGEQEGERLLPNMTPAGIPSSGGRGTMLFILLGILIMGGGLLIGFAALKHNGRKRDNRML